MIELEKLSGKDKCDVCKKSEYYGTFYKLTLGDLAPIIICGRCLINLKEGIYIIIDKNFLTGIII